MCGPILIWRPSWSALRAGAVAIRTDHVGMSASVIFVWGSGDAAGDESDAGIGPAGRPPISDLRQLGNTNRTSEQGQSPSTHSSLRCINPDETNCFCKSREIPTYA